MEGVTPHSAIAVASVVTAIGVVAYVDSRGNVENLNDIKRLRKRLGVYAAAVVLWPAIVAALLSDIDPLNYPITISLAVVVLVYLSFEVSVTSCFSGPLCDYDSTDSVYERSVQVSTVAFAVSMMLLSQKNEELANLAAPTVFMALLCCTVAAVPSAVARRRVGASGRWAALQKAAVSFAAGLLCVALARCMDELSAQQTQNVS